MKEVVSAPQVQNLESGGNADPKNVAAGDPGVEDFGMMDYDSDYFPESPLMDGSEEFSIFRENNGENNGAGQPRRVPKCVRVPFGPPSPEYAMVEETLETGERICRKIPMEGQGNTFDATRHRDTAPSRFFHIWWFFL